MVQSMLVNQYDIPVNKPFLPPKREFDALTDGIWNRNWLTNHGPLVHEFERKLSKYLEIPYVLFVTNGTIALQLAIKSLDLQGEIITTPFSYVATTNSILWEKCTPVFADIDPKTLTISAEKVEELISEKTVGILATHVFGIPCDTEALAAIGKNYSIPIIYDGAHALGTKYKKKSLLSYGSVSTLSFHATKLMHTVEGGAVCTFDKQVYLRLKQLMNFGHIDQNEFELAGINGKNSEFHAAMGLANFNNLDTILAKRIELSQQYDFVLKDLPIERPIIPNETQYNHAYLPIILPTEQATLACKEFLAKERIECRRYFYPSLSTLSYVNQKQHQTPISDSISSRILCLPLYHSLKTDDINRVTTALTQFCDFHL